MSPAVARAAGIALKLAVYALLAFIGLIVFPSVLYPLAGTLATAALGTFAAAAVTNAITMRIFERAGLFALGFHWVAGSARNLLLGVAGGLAAAISVLVVPLLAGKAQMVQDPQQPGSFSAVLFVTVLLLFGAVGEELLLRGYPFQLLVGKMGAFATILPISLLFAMLHANNPNATFLGLVNTAGFGVVLGYAMVRSGDLWLPSGIHFAWNWVLPMAGVNLSGFTMGVTGITIRWSGGPLWSGGAYGPEAGLLTSVVIVALFWYVHKAPVVAQVPLLLRPEPEA